LLDEKLDDVRKYQGTILQKDTRYPFWRVAVSTNGKYVCCASRKINIFVSSDNELKVNDGPRVNDGDSDHVRSLRILDNYLLISRTTVPKTKIFDLTDGKEIKAFSCKKAVAQVDFLCDNFHIIVCQQEEIKANQPIKPCIMKIIQYGTNDQLKKKYC